MTIRFSVTNYCFNYGNTSILNKISIPEVSAGKLVGLLGANGVGKSSFLKSLAGLEHYSGQVILSGRDLQNTTAYERMQTVGYMPQTLPQATSLTAYEAVFSACRAVRPDLSQQTVEERLEEVFSALDIEDLAFKALGKMSGGQRQMAGLAQVLVKKPELLLLDEPTSVLDLRWQLGVFDVVRRILAEQQAICITALHDINLAMRHCDFIALFAGGELLTFGTPTEAVTEDSLERAYGVKATVEVSSSGHPMAIIHSKAS